MLNIFKCLKCYKKSVSMGMFIILSLFLTSCSQGIRFKNMLNYPISLTNLASLDTLKISPEFVKYVGSPIEAFRIFQKNIYLRGEHESRALWTGEDQGCLQVTRDARVYISDFNFQGNGADTALIRVESGRLVLENCDFIASEFWAIEVDSGASLVLRNVHFSNLAAGAIHIKGGQVKISNGQFDHINKTAIYASKADLLEIHHSNFSSTMGSALDIHSIEEVWLDSVQIIDSFQDGLMMNNCAYVLINQLETRENGRHGLTMSNASICGIVNLSALGNLVNGIEVNQVDTLRILNSEFIGNGQDGGIITNTQRSRLAGTRVGNNGVGGLQFTNGNEVWINRSSFQANSQLGLTMNLVKVVKLDRISWVNNGSGLAMSDFDSLGMNNSLFSSNGSKAMDVSKGSRVSANMNLFKGNNLGLEIADVLYVTLDSNLVEGNQLGNDIRSVPKLTMHDNVWVSNVSGAYFSHIGSMMSIHDRWESNLDTGLEVLSAEDLTLSGATFHNSRNGARLNEVSVRIESSSLDSCREAGLRLMNGHLVMHKTRLDHNGTAVYLGEGSQAKITQCIFSQNERVIDAGASVSISLSFSSIRDSRKGIRLGNYGEASFLSNQFNQVDDFCIELSGRHLQSLTLRQNLIFQAGGVLNSKTESGKIQLQSNTFANNISGISAVEATLSKVDHNIFYHTSMIDPALLRDGQLFQSNCIFPEPDSLVLASLDFTNITSDPIFDTDFYLTSSSECLNGGGNGLLIGARGLAPEDRPRLQP